ncbi:MAG TPA: hypothetical protein GXX25_03365 [Desulfotomaculum sp.]|nr:hypothetical protein [Desulfotomaculum sp.]
MCPEEGVLQAYLDGELDGDSCARVAGHLARCSACRQRVHDLEKLAGRVNVVLRAYRRGTEESERPVRVPRPGSVVSRYQPLTKKRGIGNMIRQHKWFSGLVAAVLALALFLSWAPGRSLATQFLNVFRMEKIQVIRIAPEDMAQLEKAFNGRGGEVDIQNFGRVEVQQPAQRQIEAAPDQVRALSGLPLDLPATLAGRVRAKVLVSGAPTVTITPDVEKLNSYLEKHGGVLLPADLAGKTFTMKVPPVVDALYQGKNGSFHLYASRDLTIEAPQGVDVLALRRAMLGLPFLPDNLRRQLAAIDDWQHTLPIPETRGMTAREIMVNGHAGVYFSHAGNNGKAGQDVLLAWRQDNSWRAIGGLPLEEALRIAAEVK